MAPPGTDLERVIDTALSLQLIEASQILIEDVDELREALKESGPDVSGHTHDGRTHGVHAEPITFGLKLASWWEEMGRQRERLGRALDGVRVGKISGAVGPHATVPPRVEERACRMLVIDVDPISSQIIQRDRHAHFITTLALIAASLEKFATEVRSLQRTEVREVEKPFREGQTGHPPMPHSATPSSASASVDWPGS